jgi:3-isopropylmalate/(R)-2-methylmalate dehydratase small subunit
MQPFTNLSSKIIPIPLKDIDTDMIIPAQYMTQTGKEGYGEHVFERFRQADPNFPLNIPKFQGSGIILAQENFGCGSSREHAVWALASAGIRVVIAPSFADIFFNNSGKNGLVTIVLPQETVDKLFTHTQRKDLEAKVDLENQKLIVDGVGQFTFEYDQFRKECILKGLDDLDYILNYSREIDEWQKNHQKNIYFSTLRTNN